MGINEVGESTTQRRLIKKGNGEINIELYFKTVFLTLQYLKILDM